MSHSKTQQIEHFSFCIPGQNSFRNFVKKSNRLDENIVERIKQSFGGQKRQMTESVGLMLSTCLAEFRSTSPDLFNRVYSFMRINDRVNTDIQRDQFESIVSKLKETLANSDCVGSFNYFNNRFYGLLLCDQSSVMVLK